MPYPINEIKSDLFKLQQKIAESVYKKITPLNVTIWKTKEPVPFEERFSGEKRSITPGESWGEIWDCAWFQFSGEIPPEAAGKHVVLLIDVSGEACIYDAEGCPIQGLTNVSSEYDLSLGNPGKRVVDVSVYAQGGEKIDIIADAGCNDLFGKYQDSRTLKDAHIALCNDTMLMLLYDFEVLYGLMQVLPEKSSRACSIMHALNKAALILNDFTEEEAVLARNILLPELQKKGGDTSLSISAIGHAHIDLAWLWPIRETKRKAARTFSTVLMMMDRYPDYVFGASQPQLYAWVKEIYPALYNKITEKVFEGRWEPQGGMWVEADTNISGGEALVRQILYGKRFFKNEFNRDMRVLWLPDVFGYSGALPQILKKSGIDYFMTIKLSWNVHNKFPHHTFIWKGIDGSEVLAHMPPEGTYNSEAAPSSIKNAEYNHFDSGVASECLMLFGIGDGGGGPGEDHLERLAREKNLYGLPPVKQEPSIDFFDRLNTNRESYKVWVGELYLEKHQGTLTTQAKNKRCNRKIEIALRELEFVSVLAQLSKGYNYPAAQIEALWKEVLLYQFHDILPGSSIKRVYSESLNRYEAISNAISALLKKAYQVILPKAPVVFNTLSWQRTQWIKHDNSWYKITVPPMGYVPLKTSGSSVEDVPLKTFESSMEDVPLKLHELDLNNSVCLEVENNRLENDLLRVSFNDDGSISYVYDKENCKEVLYPEAKGNVLAVYHDRGDAWDFSIQYDKKPSMRFKLESSQPIKDGPCVAILQKYTFGSSSIEQKIILTSESRRVDFKTKVNWNEDNKMLRTSFPVDISAMDTTCDIQFGSIRRPTHENTSFDMAKYEIAAHKWVDISEPFYGVALLNDCKYGYSVNGNTLDLNLLRSPEYPDECADRGEHYFTYSLYPHAGNHITGKVNQVAYELNIPLTVHEPNDRAENSESESRQVCESIPFVELDNDNVVVEAIKKAEDNDDIIIRLYECNGSATSAKIKMGVVPESAFLTDLMEQDLREVVIRDNTIELSSKPFEITTLKLRF
ncbi:MAG: alpha-mannosidase [Ruminiclostridium sp.]|nr:alpha-mannosidase [Ruminiclostridium sp.]